MYPLGKQFEVDNTKAVCDKDDTFNLEVGIGILTESVSSALINWNVNEVLRGLIIDGIFGVGLSRTITGKYETAIKQMNEMNAYKIAIDISSGVSGENGAIQGIAFRADRTFTFSFGKTGQYLWEGSDYSGKIHVLPIGITLDGFKDTDSLVSVLEDTDLNELIPKRIQHSNKGTYGKVLIIAGHNIRAPRELGVPFKKESR